jgi:hypothetical protein
MVLLLPAACILLVVALVRPAWVMLLGIPIFAVFVTRPEYAQLGIAVSGALVLSWIAGLARDDYPIDVVAHGALALFAAWVTFIFVLIPPDAPLPYSRSDDLITLLLGVGVCAAAVSVPVSVRALLMATGASGLLASLVVLSEGVGPGEEDRAIALGLNANFLGILIAMSMVAIAAYALSTKRYVLLAAELPCLLALGSVRSRESLIALTVGVLVLALTGRSLRVKVAVALAAVVFALSPLLGLLLDTTLGERQTTDTSHSDAKRFALIDAAVQLSEEHLLTGVGYGIFPLRSTEDFSQRLEFAPTHNDYLRLSAETGLIGLGSFLLLVVLGLTAPSANDAERGRRAVLVTYLVGLAFANSLSNLSVTMPFWLLLGSAMAARRSTQRAA